MEDIFVLINNNAFTDSVRNTIIIQIYYLKTDTCT